MSFGGAEAALALALKKTMAALSSDFWQMRGAHWVTIAIFILGFYGGYSKLASSQEQTAEALKQLAVRVDAIDQRGTTASRLGISTEFAQTNANTHRIEELEKSDKDLREKYTTILSRLDVIATLLENSKKK